jgi:hypothetical protein
MVEIPQGDAFDIVNRFVTRTLLLVDGVLVVLDVQFVYNFEGVGLNWL